MANACLQAAAPRFRNVETGDCQLRADSPCVDAGPNRPWMADATDLGGNTRIYGGGTVDIERREYAGDEPGGGEPP